MSTIWQRINPGFLPPTSPGDRKAQRILERVRELRITRWHFWVVPLLGSFLELFLCRSVGQYLRRLLRFNIQPPLRIQTATEQLMSAWKCVRLKFDIFEWALQDV